jgi:hypothetical protein
VKHYQLPKLCSWTTPTASKAKAALPPEAIVRQKRNRNPRKKTYVAGKSYERRRII